MIVRAATHEEINVTRECCRCQSRLGALAIAIHDDQDILAFPFVVCSEACAGEIVAHLDDTGPDDWTNACVFDWLSDHSMRIWRAVNA